MRSRISQLVSYSVWPAKKYFKKIFWYYFQMGIEYKFDLMLSTDGSGRGAALVAAVLMGECKI